MPPGLPPRGALLALALVPFAAATLWWGVGDRLTPAALAESQAVLMEWRRAQGALAVVVFFAAVAVAALVSLPGIAVFTLAGGLLFGALWGTLIVVVAATLGATGLYLLARAGIGDALWRRLEAGRGASFAAELKRNEIKALLLLRIAPVVPFFMANTLPAVMGVRPMRYAATTFAGLLPGTAAIALAGGTLSDLAASGGDVHLGTMGVLLIGVPMILLLSALAGRLLRR